MKNNAVLIVATMDTKGYEAKFLESCFKKARVNSIILDAGIRGKSPYPVTIRREDVAIKGGSSIEQVRTLKNEGDAISIMARGASLFAKELYEKNEIHGVIGIGGSMGTTLATTVMRSLPIGFPKLMITTMASRDTRFFVGTKDIMMLHSVCDISGINRITEKVFVNGANAMIGMIKNRVEFLKPDKPLILLSTLGTTEVCAQYIKKFLEEKGREVMVFHTNGSGGEAMEEVIMDEEIEAVIDLSLHELVDHYFGGDYDAGPNRGQAALKKGIPTIIIPGNIDFIVTGGINKAKKFFPNRNYHVHNSAITTIRTKKNEIKFIADLIVKFCGEAKGYVKIMIPEGGFSVWDQKGHPFYDPKAVKLFIDTVKKGLTEKTLFEVVPYNINTFEFASAVFDALRSILKE